MACPRIFVGRPFFISGGFRKMKNLPLVFLALVFCEATSSAQWVKVNSGLGNLNVNALVASGTYLFAGTIGTNAGVYRSADNGASWGAVNTGLTSTDVLTLAACRKNRYGPANTLIAGTNMHGIFCSTNDGGRWFPGSVTSESVHAFAVEDTTTYVGTIYNGTWRSVDGGWNYTSINTGLSDVYGTLPVKALAANSADVFAGAYAVNRNTTGVYRSTNRGANWTQTAIKTLAVPALALIDSVLFAGIYQYNGGPSGVYRSTDKGNSWTSVGLTGASTIHTFAVGGSDLFAGTSAGLFRSMNLGADWLEIGMGLPGPVNTIAILGPNIFVGIYGSGVYRKALADALPIQLFTFTATVVGDRTVRLHWKTLTEINNYGFEIQKSSSLPEYTSIPGVFVPGHGTTVTPNEYSWADTCATEGTYYRLKQIDQNGMVHFSDGIHANSATGVEDSRALPRMMSLGQNYPNPFNPTTRIRYVVGRVVVPSGALLSGVEGPASSKVSLVVFDLLGREVAVLVNERKEPGSYAVSFDGRNLPSGVYIYRLTVDSFVESHKMTLIK
jgi:hypothetical protein